MQVKSLRRTVAYSVGIIASKNHVMHDEMEVSAQRDLINEVAIASRTTNQTEHRS